MAHHHQEKANHHKNYPNANNGLRPVEVNQHVNQ